MDHTLGTCIQVYYLLVVNADCWQHIGLNGATVCIIHDQEELFNNLMLAVSNLYSTGQSKNVYKILRCTIPYSIPQLSSLVLLLVFLMSYERIAHMERQL